MLCREILEGLAGGLFAPAPSPRPLGAGVCASWRRFFSFLASIFRKTGMCETVFCTDSGCAEFCAESYADFWCADFSSTFWRLKKKVFQSHPKIAQKISGKSYGVHMALFGGVTHSISAFLRRQHVTQSPLGRRTQGEHARVHRDIFGLKGMLAFAPRISKKSALRTISL